jgi:hypothetical protein
MLELSSGTGSASARSPNGARATDKTQRGSKAGETAMKDFAQLLRAIAEQVLQARLSTGARVLDPTDFREWLIGLAEKAEQADTLEQFLS